MSGPEVTFAVATGGRVVREAATPGGMLPRSHLGMTGFHPAVGEGGRIELHDSAGQSWGIFASEELARQTAEALSR